MRQQEQPPVEPAPPSDPFVFPERKTFTPADWYWYVAGDTSRAWSSKSSAYVAAADVPSDAGTTSIDTEESLADVLRPYGLDAPLVMSEDVSAERDRRIALGAVVTIGGVTFTVQTRDEIDFRNINGLVSKGILLTMTSDPSTVTFRDADNVDHVLSGAGLVSMGSQIAAHVDALYKASWALKALSPIPLDYTADSYWVGS